MDGNLGRISLDSNRSKSSEARAAAAFKQSLQEVDVSSFTVEAARLKALLLILKAPRVGFGVALLPGPAPSGSSRLLSRRGHHWVTPRAARRPLPHAAELENTLPSGSGHPRGSHGGGRGRLTTLRKGGSKSIQELVVFIACCRKRRRVPCQAAQQNLSFHRGCVSLLVPLWACGTL